jgi:tight adherence protein B
MRSGTNSSPDLSQRLMQSFSILGKIVVLIEGSLTDVKRLKEIDGHPFRIVLFSGAGAILSLGASMFLTHSLSLGIMAAIIGTYATLHVYMQIKFQRYSDIVLKSFPSAVDGLIRCLKAGFDLSRSLTIVSDELPRELQYEFKIMIRNRNLGQSLGDAMYFLASRLQSREAMFLATLIAVQEKTGGPLVHALESLSQILKDRERLRQKRLVASAEARMSAMILGGLPVAVALLLFATNPSYRDILLETQTGRAALILGVILLVMGSIVMHRMIRMPSS